MPLFPEEIYRKPPGPLFSGLRDRLIERLREQVRNGSVTERGLARKARLSQSHLHNVLKGIRTLSDASADALLGAMSWSVLDLIPPDKTALGAEPSAGVPVLSGAAGPGGVWSEDIQSEQSLTISCQFLATLTAAAALRVLPDPEMRTLPGFALVDRGRESRAARDGSSVYVVAREGAAMLRYVRFGREAVYLPTVANLSRPLEWEGVARPADMPGLVLARVCTYL